MGAKSYLESFPGAVTRNSEKGRGGMENLLRRAFDEDSIGAKMSAKVSPTPPRLANDVVKQIVGIAAKLR